MGRKGGYETLPLTFEIITGGDLVWRANNNNGISTIEYSLNGGPWTSITSNRNPGVAIPVSEGDIIMFRGSQEPGRYGYYSSFRNDVSGGATFIAYGNPASLAVGEKPTGREVLGSYAFNSLFGYSKILSASGLYLGMPSVSDLCYYMFSGCSLLEEAPELPVKEVANAAYRGMFYGCTSLTKAPDLPATIIASACYAEMFSGCTSLTEAPDLPATTLAAQCYDNMFHNCTSLILAPELEAPILVDRCYNNMFNGCSQLGQIICPATDISASNAINTWLSGVAAQGTFYKRAGVTWPSGDSGIPSGWTVIEV